MNEEEMDANSFLRSLEEQNGGPLEWKTYAFFIGASGDQHTRSLGGLIYAVSGKVVFEDFERENTLFKLFGKKNTYEKFKIEAPLSSIRELRSISASDAKRVVNSKAEASELEPLAGLRKVLSKRTEALIFEDGSAWFFEMYDHDGLRAILEHNGRTT